MTKTTFCWINMGPKSSAPGRKVILLYQECTAGIASYLDAKTVDPKAPAMLKDDTPISGDMTAVRFYHRTSTGHVYVPLVNDTTPLDTFWHWVRCATDQDPAGVALPMFVLLCAKRKGTMTLQDTAKKFMEVYKMTSGHAYDNAIAKSWCQEIEKKMKDGTYTAFKAIDVITTVTLPTVTGKAGVGKAGGGTSQSRNQTMASICRSVSCCSTCCCCASCLWRLGITSCGRRCRLC